MKRMLEYEYAQRQAGLNHCIVGPHAGQLGKKCELAGLVENRHPLKGPFVASPPLPAAKTDSGIDRHHLILLLTQAREELGRTDAKASLLFSAMGVVGGVMAAALLAGDWRPSDLDPSMRWLWWIGVASFTCSVAALAVAVYPSIRGGRSALISYFGSVSGHTVGSLKAALQREEGEGGRSVVDAVHSCRNARDSEVPCTASFNLAACCCRFVL